jgi:3-hydroxybutyryl-CoA dehydrogenase
MAGAPAPLTAGTIAALIRVVAVIGAGSAGRRFALRCAAAGLDVVLEDVMPENLRRAEGEYLALDDGAMTSPGGRLSVALTVEAAVERADLAIDFVPDELESKLEIFSLMDRMAPPRTIFLTPSDALSITDLASCVYRPERCFAVRGELLGRAVRVLYPAGCSEGALAGVEGFLRRVGLSVEIEADPDVPMLVKNLG